MTSINCFTSKLENGRKSKDQRIEYLRNVPPPPQVQRLTLQLYHRDRRRQFCPDEHWTRPSIADSIRLDQHSWLRRQMQSKDVPPLKRVPFGYYSIFNAKRRLEGGWRS